jgi:gliding motility-associated-like protein
MKTVKGTWLQLLQLSVLLLITTAGSAQLKAGFFATPVSGCPPMVVSFTDTSKGNPVSWKWDLGNGTISFLQHPVATYFTPGSYNVKLVVTSISGKDSVVKSQYIVVNSLPEAYFSALDSTGCFPLKVTFKDSSLAGSGRVQKWQWDFGDGTLSTQQNPSHTYTSPGSFTVILRVTNSNGCAAVITKPSFITIRDGVSAAFSYTAVPGCTSPAPVNFINESKGSGTLSYFWEFGDGKNSTAANPANSYKNGTYTVKLIATSSYGCTDTIVKQNAINVGIVRAGLSSVDTICAGNNLELSNTSAPATFNSVQWDFGDGGSSTQTNPGRIYASAGQYKIKLVTTFGICQDSAVKTITVLPRPTAAFTASNTSGCAGPLVVSFQDASTSAISYIWSFGDGGTSTLRNPTHQYTAPGTYSVSLTVANTIGCTTTLVMDNLVKFIPLKIESIDNLGVKGCLPVTVSPVASIKDNVAVGTYLWSFGDGSTSTSATPTHTYTTPGVFDVKLIVTTGGGCQDTFVFKEAVKAGNQPQTKFTAAPKDVCAVSPVSFSDLSAKGTADEWRWMFGDGATSGIQNPVHSYNDTGYFDVKLITTNFGCNDTLEVKKFIHVKPPIARFDTSYTCSDRFTRNFIDQSVGAMTWNWNFGDGATSTEQHPLHTYSTPGGYTAVLTVTNGECEHTVKKNIVVLNEQGKLVASSTINCMNAPVVFDVKNVNPSNISAFNWYFDGITENVTTTTTSPVSIRFNTPGTRNSAAIITDLLHCSDTLFTTVPLLFYGPTALFESIAPNTCLGNTVNFADSSKTDGIHPVTEYVWSFGEGNPEKYASGPFSHNYSALGNYNVKLVIKDSYGCTDSITRESYVSITKPVAKFITSDTALCPSLPINFTNQSDGVGATYQWNFGDGTTSATVSPVHSFSQPGAYKVVMVMVDKNGCSASDSITINIYTAKADFILSDSFSTCPPLVVNVTNQSKNYIDLNWDFGDGGNSQLTNPSHIYTYPGSYTLKLTVKNNGGCVDELIKKVVIQGPSGRFDYLPKQACNPGKVDYRITSENTASYVWDFDDGNTIFSVKTGVSHTYINPGNYVPKVILEDGLGCKVAIQGLDTIRIFSVNTNILSDSKMVCDSGIVAFRDSTTSNNGVSSFLWNFGDGFTSTQRNPTHNFSDTGFYSIKLTTTTAFGCVDSAVSKNYIKVVKSPLIKISGDTSACEPAKIKLTADITRADTSALTWAWNFSNGAVSGLQKPDSQNFVRSGSYRVTLKATNSDGCFNQVTRTAVIHPKPVVDAGPDAGVCRFDTYKLNATGADNYTWRSNATLNCTNCATPTAKPGSLTTYYVTGKTLFGCTSEDSVTLKVQQTFKVTVGKADTLCKGEIATLRASGADNYQWTPALWLDNATIASPQAKPDATITYQVIGKDNNGCFRDTQNVSIKVNPLPSIDITNGDNITLDVGGSIKLKTNSSTDVLSWKWFPSQWLSCVSCTEPVAAPKENITYRVTATNEGNCTAADKVTINLVCNNANVFIPNTFSPNGDGINDVFYVRGSGLFNILSFKVFTKLGQLVYQKNGGSANNALDGWDGNLNGVPLQPDVYIYAIDVVCANNTIFPFKGNITLIR